MRVDRRPLLDTAVDADLFVGRAAELARLRRAVELGLNAVVTGPAGMGTTSLLRHLAWRLRGEGVEPVQVSAADVEDAAGLLRKLLGRLAGEEAVAVAMVASLDASALVDRIAGILTGRTVVLVDDLPVDVGRAVFGALRDEVWRLAVTWIVGVPESAAAGVLRPPVDVFFEVVVELGPLSDGPARKLLRRRGLELAKPDAVTVTELGDGVPRRIVDLARALVLDGRTLDDLRTERVTRADRLNRVSEPAAALAAALEQLGSAGPSDTTLQARLGVSRPRLVTLFRELLDAGIVHELPPDRTAPGPGRPRSRYALEPAADAGGPAPRNVGGVREAASDDY